MATENSLSMKCAFWRKWGHMQTCRRTTQRPQTITELWFKVNPLWWLDLSLQTIVQFITFLSHEKHENMQAKS